MVTAHELLKLIFQHAIIAIRNNRNPMIPDRAIDADLLQAFVAVVDCGGFSRAGERLLRSQSTVSLQIKRLENHLGVTLLERTPRRVDLTGQGEIILDYARRILALNHELAQRVKEPELSGLVRLGAPEDFATSHLPRVLAHFSDNHPRVSLEVTCELTLDVIERFNAGGLDLALIKREPTGVQGGLRVWREPLVCVARDRTVVETEGSLPLAASPQPCVYRRRMTRALDAAGRPWRMAYTCGSLAGTHAAVRAGLGMTILPKEMVPSDLTILSKEELGLPDLRDTEMALMEAPQLSTAAARLRDDIIRELEHAG